MDDAESEGTQTLNSIIQDVLRHHENTSSIALVYDDFVSKKELTYSQLQSTIKEINAILKLFCKPGEYVGVDSHPSLEMLTVLLSVINIGAVFCPLDLRNNLSQAIDLCSKLGIKTLMIENESTTDKLRLQDWLSGTELQTISIQNLTGSISIVKLNNLIGALVPTMNDIEFIVQSSGSTGSSKIIKVPGKCIYPNIKDLCCKLKVSRKDTVFLSSPLTFDASIVQIFISLICAATLLIVSDDVKRQPSKLSDVLFKRNSTSILQATPSLIENIGEHLLSCGNTFSDTPLKVICLGAEPFPSQHSIQRLVGSRSTLELYNIYGISEVSSWASLQRVSLVSSDNPSLFLHGLVSSLSNIPSNIDKKLCEQICNQSTSIGDPLSDTFIELRSETGVTVSEGLGEIWIGGRNRVCLVDDETDLVQNTMRFSGDIGVIKDGKIYYIGRKDNRIKIHGQFIDLELIESVVQDLPGVKAAVCVPLKKDHLATRSYLYLFISVSEEVVQKEIKKEIFAVIRSNFPNYCIPSKIICLPSVPITSHGKKDRKSVQKLANSMLSNGGVQIHSNLEEAILQFLQDALETGNEYEVIYDRDKSFIENGGNSIMAVFVENEIRNLVLHHTSRNLELLVLFDYISSKSYESLVQYVTDEMRKNTNSPPESPKIAKRFALDYIPVSRKKKKDEEDCPSIDLHEEILNEDKLNDLDCVAAGCYCSLSRGNRMTVCGICIREGNMSSCFERCKNQSSCRMESLHTVWKVNTGKCVDASPLIVCNSHHPVVYIGSHSHHFVAIKVDDGQIVWDTELGDRIESSAALSKDGRKLIVGSYDHMVNILNRKSGEILWRFRTGDCVKSCPVINNDDGIVYIGSHDQHLYALNIDKREQVWRRYCGGGSCFSSPVLCKDNKKILIGTLAGNLLAIEAHNGEMEWKFTTGKPIFSSPNVCENKVFFGCVDQFVYAMSMEGFLLWKFATNGPIFSSPLSIDLLPSKLDGAIVFGSHDNHVYCVSNEGHVLWKFDAGSPVFSTPSFIELKDHTAAKLPSCRGYIIVCSSKGKLFFINLTNGKGTNFYDLRNEIFSSPVVFHDMVVVGCRDNNVYCFTIE